MNNSMNVFLLAFFKDGLEWCYLEDIPKTFPYTYSLPVRIYWESGYKIVLKKPLYFSFSFFHFVFLN